ncbi:hypothetical protein HIM_07189 [Hirsutella minnesotensis 3608]|uniref:Mtf2-like C-terminal domain-containing protein n=1 Tax=Hirsutella minnesotensis 3608 TaxID=1043627 RepID=A0A0F7ZNA2_9HYPO|nr:hypothetical protein HIM_07189 [Hirsutella minnesotensis 3608]
MVLRSPATRILGRACATRPGVCSRLPVWAAWLHSGNSGRNPDGTVAFPWKYRDSPSESGIVNQRTSTITPSEEEVFRAIFDEIAQGRIAVKKAWGLGRASTQQPGETTVGHITDADSEPIARQGFPYRSTSETTRVVQFREAALRRYPASLRDAAQHALGLYNLGGSSLTERKPIELDEEAEREKKEARLQYAPVRVQERKRVENLMWSCKTDLELWEIMEAEVFSLPEKLGFVQSNKKTPRKKATQAEAGEASATEQAPDSEDEKKRKIYVHGPLYPHFISYGLKHLGRSFARPSPLAFNVLPRIKELGPSSYVLGVSTPLYGRLARLHWEQRGDAHAALNVLQEMIYVGLQADDYIVDFLVKLRFQLQGCAGGEQGPFVAAVVDTLRQDQVFIYFTEMVNESCAEDDMDAA